MMKKKKETDKKKQTELLKCYKCGFIMTEKTKYCPQCLQEELQILMQPFIEK